MLAAVSGGPDSTALLHWLVERGVPVEAAHYDHALRPGSEADAAFVALVCRELGVPLHRERRSVPLPPGSRQAAARELRYSFLERAREAAGCELIATGHIADDVVEGVLLHLRRGSGLAGMRGMPARRGPVVRPLLDVWRRDVEAYLAARGVEPRRDPSNDDTDHYARAGVRHTLVPALEAERPGLSGRIRRAAATAGRLQEELERRARAAGADRDTLRRRPRAVRYEAYRQLHGHLPALSRRQLAAIDRLALDGRTGSGLDLPAGRLWVERDRVVLDAPPRPGAPLPRVVAARCPGCAAGVAEGVHLAPDADPSAVRAGHRTPGLRIRPADGPGRAGSRKLQDVLVDARVPRRLRDGLPLVFLGDRLAWVPGVAADRELTISTRRPGIHLSLRR
ncbi:MAG TPA: tRNA lysidine(34) synthetase TilS [Candidatus Binatia bacterium]|nr:tRNA lysidine(34) synthetase TilS [Candidatus Binatia bacterium]